MNTYLKIETFAQSAYKKCDCCSRVRDINFRLNVYDVGSPLMLIGSFELCRVCGQNMGSILKQKVEIEEEEPYKKIF